ncbi:Glycosyl hydrolases family 16 [Flaviramulus basaltis]|uniref:Glycosyl hydrolases family 16 n=1 Tax=Flaviramulus basaltis TaxID=369401 RepID=A0A1K2INP9_9FLAO|nr:glycoside hydrolase family 16 protein [Flaviramulus basaltis]SFZ94077.1 Glycosyl hydrolases family 16 [Flaviramulus basaltis]
MKNGFLLNTCFLSCFLFLLINYSCASKKHITSTYDDYHLVWSDEFNTDGIPNKDNWDYELGFVRNQEEQWYQKENAICKDGYLIIHAKKETKKNPNFTSKSEINWKKNRDSIKITSSCLITKDKHSWQYGRFEMRAKIPTSNGIWPAFWTLGTQGNWPANGEIDIMEYYKGKILANIAWESDKKWTPIWDSETVDLKEFETPKWHEQFHIWRMDWDENSIKLFVDNQLLNEVDLKTTFNGTNRKNPFHQPHYLLLNLAVGGINGGEVTQESLPTEFVIDYVRVYQ